MTTKNTSFKPWGKAKDRLEKQAMADTEEHYISKSQAKRDVEELQKLGLKLLALSKTNLIKFNLDEKLLDALLLAQTIKSHSGHRRQIQLIGKLMRHTDVDNIRQQLKYYQNPIDEANKQFHEIEQWRDKILSEGDSAIQILLDKHPQFERSRLRQLLRNAKKEAGLKKAPKSTRQLFQYLKEVIITE